MPLVLVEKIFLKYSKVAYIERMYSVDWQAENLLYIIYLYLITKYI